MDALVDLAGKLQSYVVVEDPRYVLPECLKFVHLARATQKAFWMRAVLGSKGRKNRSCKIAVWGCRAAEFAKLQLEWFDR